MDRRVMILLLRGRRRRWRHDSLLDTYLWNFERGAGKSLGIWVLALIDDDTRRKRTCCDCDERMRFSLSEMLPTVYDSERGLLSFDKLLYTSSA